MKIDILSARSKEPRRLAVLGGCGGVGRCLVQEAMKQGVDVVVMDLVASLKNHPVPEGVSSYAVDATSQSSLKSAFTSIERDWGALDGFVNLCGFVSETRPLSSFDFPEWQATIAGNLTAAFLASNLAIPLLKKGVGGSLVNTTSGLAAHTRPGFGAYAAAKAGVNSLTKTLALEHAPTVRINAVAPGAIRTAFLDGGTGRADNFSKPLVNVDAMAAATPMQRIAEPTDVVDPILFLLSDASRYITGQILWVNGGGYMP